MTEFDHDPSDPDDDPRHQQPLNDDTVVENRTPRLEDYVPENYQPLIDGASVGISARLIALGEATFHVELPDFPPEAEVLHPIADTVSDEEVLAYVDSELRQRPLIAMMLYVAALLQKASERSKRRLERQTVRALARQQSLPADVPRRKGENFSIRGQLTDLARFWGNWSGLAFAAFFAALGVAVIVEITTQVVAFLGGEWEQTQSVLGAFGFTWAFTIGAVAITRWRRSVCTDPHSDPLHQTMSRYGLKLAWGGLALLGFVIGTLHELGPDESLVVWLIRSAMTTSMVLILGITCVALESFCEEKFRCAMSWIEIPNPVIEEIEAQLQPLELNQITIDQIATLAKAIGERIEKYVGSQTKRWLSQRDHYRAEHQSQRETEALETKISNLASQLRQAQEAFKSRHKRSASPTSSF